VRREREPRDSSFPEGAGRGGDCSTGAERDRANGRVHGPCGLAVWRRHLCLLSIGAGAEERSNAATYSRSTKSRSSPGFGGETERSRHHEASHHISVFDGRCCRLGRVRAPKLDLNINIPGAKNEEQGIASKTTFTFVANKAGRFLWVCKLPCDGGQGYWDMKNPSKKIGFMAGYITVTA
jgi:hypothetical protein